MLKISKISFPGLGIGEFEVDSVAFTIFGAEIAWYAIIITIGMIVAVGYTIFRARQVGISSDDVLDFALWMIPVGVVGARLYYVFSSIESFTSLKEVLDIRSGGLAIYGGIIAGGIAAFTVALVKKIPFLVMADACTPGIILAQAIGRWGNFMNGEAFGYETDIFIRMGLNNSLTMYDTLFVHPTFLYESLWNVLGFVLINLYYKKRHYDGQIFLMVFGWYGLGRMFIEGLRSDSLYMELFGLSLRVSQVLAGAILIATASLLIYFLIKRPKKELYHKSIK